MDPALFFMAHVSKGVSARSGEARAPKLGEKQAILKIDQLPTNLLHPLSIFSQSLHLTIGGLKLYAV